MDKKLHETTNLGVKIMNSKQKVKRKLGHVRLPFDINMMLFLSSEFCPVCLCHVAQVVIHVVVQPETILVTMLKRKNFGD